MDGRFIINEALADHSRVLVKLQDHIELIARLAQVIIVTLRQGNKVLICGNGGSAADAQHLAAELVGRFLKERRGLPVIALSVNTSVLTALGNDYSFNYVFARQVEALGTPGDCLIAISTSGNSPNVIEAARAAREMGMQVAGMTGASGGALAPLCDVCLQVPSEATPRIQEMHILAGHIVCQLVEDALC